MGSVDVRSVGVIVVALALAGCASPTPNQEGTTADLSSLQSPLGGALPIGEGSPDGTSTEFHWSLRGAAPALVLDLSVDVGRDNDCTFLRGLANTADGAAPYRLSVLDQESGPSWSVGSGPGGEGIHLGATDTRLAEAGGQTALRERASGVFSGVVRILLVATDVQPWDNDLMAEGVGAAVGVTCSSPFSVREARQGQSVLLLGPASVGGGAGVEAGHGSLNVADLASASIEGTSARALCSGFGMQTAFVALEHSTGYASWAFVPDPAVSAARPLEFIDTAPGTHTFTVHRAGAYLDSMWCAAWGLDDAFPVADGQTLASAFLG